MKLRIGSLEIVYNSPNKPRPVWVKMQGKNGQKVKEVRL